METLMMRLSFKLTVGCDIYRPYLDQLKYKKIYDELVLCDASKLPFKKKSFSVCLAVEVIEHLEKDKAIACLKDLEEIATNMVIVTTPNGFTRQKPLSGNPYEEHKSGWNTTALKVYGFKIKGHGFLGMTQLMNNFPKLKPILHILRIIISPLTYIIPALAGDLIAIKRINRNL